MADLGGMRENRSPSRHRNRDRDDDAQSRVSTFTFNSENASQYVQSVAGRVSTRIVFYCS
jgi:hypothetical protein